MRHRWPRKLVVKGISCGNDADRLVVLGAHAIAVSDHCGRQLDGAVATLDALPAVMQGVRGPLPVPIDGGVRRGGDIAREPAVGASSVLLGRAALLAAVAAATPAPCARSISRATDSHARCSALRRAPLDGCGGDLLRPAPAHRHDDRPLSSVADDDRLRRGRDGRWRVLQAALPDLVRIGPRSLGRSPRRQYRTQS